MGWKSLLLLTPSRVYVAICLIQSGKPSVINYTTEVSEKVLFVYLDKQSIPL